MQNVLRILRYIVFALIVACNAIIASVAVWNQSVSPTNALVYGIDISATCIAALGLVFSFTILFLELAGQDSVAGKVWFECTWVSALFVINFAVASAASAILVTQSCIPGFVDACTSTQTLLSFSWLITFVLLIYGLTLFASIYLVRGEHIDIWSMHVNHIPRLSPKHKLCSRPPTPVFATFANIPRAPSLVAPVPRPFRTFPMDDTVDTYQHHSEFDLEHGIERFEQEVHPAPRPIQRLPTLSDDMCQHSRFDPGYGVERFEQEVHPAPRPIQRLPTLSDDMCQHSRFDPGYGVEHFEPEVHPVPRPIQRLPALSVDTCQHSGLDPEYGLERFEPEVHPAPRPIQRLPALSDDSHRPAPSLYPQFIQSALPSDPRAQQQSFSAPERQGSLSQRMPSPPPLTNWPRHDVLAQPVKSKSAKNSVDSNTALSPNISQHPLGPRGMPSSLEGGGAVGTEAGPYVV